MSRRFHFSLRALLVIMLVVGVSYWLNRDAPALAAVGAAGAVLFRRLLLAGDAREQRDALCSFHHYWGHLTAVARRATFD